jgi:hypothetical protein
MSYFWCSTLLKLVKPGPLLNHRPILHQVFLDNQLYAQVQFMSAQSPNGRSPEATFSDVLASVRRALWHNFNYQTSAVAPDMVLIPRTDLERLAYAVCY